jgi:hypothetical protein
MHTCYMASVQYSFLQSSLENEVKHLVQVKSSTLLISAACNLLLLARVNNHTLIRERRSILVHFFEGFLPVLGTHIL